MKFQSKKPNLLKGPGLQDGLSLVELMIALLLSTFIILGVLTMYLDSTKTSQVSRSLARVQEAGRISLDLIARDVRMGGFAGCADPFQKLHPAFDASTLDADFFANSLRGARVSGEHWDDFVGNNSIAALENNAVIDSDVLQLRRANGPFVTLDSEMASPDSTIVTDSDQAVTNFRVGENALITNCVAADVFAISDPDGVADNEINHDTLSNAYPEGSRVFHFNTTVYWVGDTGRTDQQGNAVFALYQDGLEVVAGVERLQTLYGVRGNDDSLRFLNSGEMDADQWDLVDVVQVGVLVSDEQSVMEASDAKGYTLPGVTVQPSGTAGADATYPDDGRLRATFSTTIKLRNQIDE
ncbi:pilus assembly protein PilW [Marinobacter adhaerens]|uniref:Pilus assembly protein PilW n=1 Tax=Marinobacter adhaerens TaxID=1033846 RepID=A0A851HUE9_9GAMM|nr:PilW family protein [Marinobacter adhaerens]NWN92633.1 pilus assembly protein PilW [Marinobacter adhaerens]